MKQKFKASSINSTACSEVFFNTYAKARNYTKVQISYQKVYENYFYIAGSLNYPALQSDL